MRELLYDTYQSAPGVEKLRDFEKQMDNIAARQTPQVEQKHRQKIDENY
jgi:hypothetical protein